MLIRTAVDRESERRNRLRLSSIKYDFTMSYLDEVNNFSINILSI